MQQNTEIESRYQYFEARRREVDTESNWSTNAVVGRPGWNWEYVQPWDEAVEHDRWSGLEYRADHFTWTHKCDDRIFCRLSFVSQHEIQRCGKCSSRSISKYPTFNSSWMIVSQWYFTTPCDRWFFFCTRCREFTNQWTHCNEECIDVLALKVDRRSRGRL